MSEPSITDAAERDRYTYATLPHCINRECDSTEFRVYGTKRRKDGSKTQYAHCRKCKRKNIIVWEP